MEASEERIRLNLIFLDCDSEDEENYIKVRETVEMILRILQHHDPQLFKNKLLSSIEIITSSQEYSNGQLI